MRPLKDGHTRRRSNKRSHTFPSGGAETTSYAALYRETLACLSERIRYVAVPAKTVHRLADDLHVDTGFLIEALGLSRRVISLMVRENRALNSGQVERIVGMQRLIGQVQAMVDESGVSEGFEAGPWFGKWIVQPLPALGGRPPAEYLGDGAGRAWISQLLKQIQAGTFA